MAQIEAGMILAGPTILDRSVNGRGYLQPGNPPGNRSRYPAMAPHNTYPCASPDTWLAITVEDEWQWQALVACMGSPAWAEAPEFSTLAGRLANQDALDERIAAWTRGQDRYALMLMLQERGVPAGVVQRAEDLLENDPQLRAREFYATADHPELGPHRFNGMPVQASRPFWRLERGAPLVGEHNEAVLGGLLGFEESAVLERTLEAATV
jgi:crotonobetainyl-CoA:carnitine CoA-transferase CaiB-like acyl-CoA transferase